MTVKKFNTTGTCYPSDHYMIDISERLVEIKALVDDGEYFCNNRPHQYGKTTTLQALADYLDDTYTTIALDFQKLDHTQYEEIGAFTQGLAKLILNAHEFAGLPIPKSILEEFELLSPMPTDAIRLHELFCTSIAGANFRRSPWS